MTHRVQPPPRVSGHRGERRAVVRFGDGAGDVRAVAVGAAPVDQGIATGLSFGLHYLLTVATQDTHPGRGRGAGRQRGEPADRRSPAGRGAGSTLAPTWPRSRSVSPCRARCAAARRGDGCAARCGRSGWRLGATGVAGSLLIGSRDARSHALAGRARPDPRSGRPGRGAGRAGGGDGPGTPSAARPRGHRGGAGRGPPRRCGRWRSPAASSAGWPWRPTPSTRGSPGRGRPLARVLPGGPQLWKLAGHAASLGLLTAAGLKRLAGPCARSRPARPLTTRCWSPTRRSATPVRPSAAARTAWCRGRRWAGRATGTCWRYVRPETFDDRPRGRRTCPSPP